MTGATFALLAATSGKTTSSGGTTFIIFLVLIALVGYFLLIRPQKQKQRRQREQQQTVGVGEEVLTVGGIVGRVVAVDADRVTIVSGGDTVGFPAVGSEPTRLVLVRNAISRRIEPPVPDAAAADLSGDDGEVDAAMGADGAADAFDGHMNGHMNGQVDAHDTTFEDGASSEGAQSEIEGTGT
ncbi:MAG: preprotein translocase subunit YajC [Actinomycetota bacterium]|nr:preprotein translocase subunit YajC [Actinomycetota bacterium]